MDVVVTFLAMLELVKVRAIRILQEEMAGPIMIEAAAGHGRSRGARSCSTKPRRNKMERDEIKSILESFLFVADGPQSVQRLAEVLDAVDKELIHRAAP